MSGPSTRVLQLLSLLQGQRHWPGAELARRLEVSLRTLRRDVERLRELGYPVQAHRGLDGGYQLAAGAALPPLVLDDDEAVALAVGLHAAAGSAVAGTAEASVRALAKVVPVMPARLRRRVDALRAVTVTSPGPAGPQVDPGVLTAVATACRDEERLLFAYTAADGRRSERTVEPHRLVSLGRRWYLVAYDLDRHDWRSFRLDRCAAPRPQGTRFRPRVLPAPDAAEFVRGGLRTLPTTYDASAVVAAPAGQVRPRLGRWATVEELGDSRCRVRTSTDALDWAAFTLACAGAELSEVQPPEVLEHLQAWAARLAAARPPEGAQPGAAARRA